jgi:hypothetical protein
VEKEERREEEQHHVKRQQEEDLEEDEEDDNDDESSPLSSFLQQTREAVNVVRRLHRQLSDGDAPVRNEMIVVVPPTVNKLRRINSSKRRGVGGRSIPLGRKKRVGGLATSPAASSSPSSSSSAPPKEEEEEEMPDVASNPSDPPPFLPSPSTEESSTTMSPPPPVPVPVGPQYATTTATARAHRRSSCLLGHAALEALCLQTLQNHDSLLSVENDDDRRDDDIITGNAPKAITKEGGGEKKKDDDDEPADSPTKRALKLLTCQAVLAATEDAEPHLQLLTTATTVDTATAEVAPPSSSLQLPLPTASTTQRRLQQFGSEYARHLSNSQLAPDEKKRQNKNKTTTTPQCLSSFLAQKNCASRSSDHTGAILDIVVVFEDQPAPVGYRVVSETASGQPFSLPVGGGGTIKKKKKKKSNRFLLCVKQEPLWDKAAQRPCITAVTVIYPDRREFVPPGFGLVRVWKGGRGGQQQQEGPPADLGGGTTERVYLCFRRSREGNPLTGLLPLSVDHQEPVPTGWTVVERTPRGHVARLSSSSDMLCFLAYRQRLCSLEALRPLPLMLDLSVRGKHEMDVYYGTGGTVVRDDAIGRFHVLDRSTHSLLSSSSVSHRLQLIERSRATAVTDQKKVSTPVMQFARSSAEMMTNEFCVGGDHHSVVSWHGAAPADRSFDGSITSGDLSLVMQSGGDYHATHKHSDVSFSLSPEEKAMSFIPTVQAAGDPEHLQTRIALLSPTLTACYSRHGGAALVAVEGLTKLILMGFFQDDLAAAEDTNVTRSTPRLTLLDLAIQAVCEVSTSSGEEITFASTVEFVERAVHLAQGCLNPRTTGFVLRFYLFVFYFEASIPQKALQWPPASWRPAEMSKQEDFPLLFDPRTESSQRLPGGASQAAALDLKELVSHSLARLGKVSVMNLCNQTLLSERTVSSSETQVVHPAEDDTRKDPYAPFLDGLVTDLVELTVDHVERANYCQLALHQIHRSGGSELFWHDMIHICGAGLFAKDSRLDHAGKDVFILIFAMLEQLIKVSSGKLRMTPPLHNKSHAEDLLPKDIATKLLALEMLLHFLEFWSDEQEAVSGMHHGRSADPLPAMDALAFVVRRTVVPCLLWNTRAGLENPQVFRRMIRIVSELWGSPVYRRHCKVELGFLMEHFALRILELGPQCKGLRKRGSRCRLKSLMLAQQIELLGEIRNWFSNDPKDVIELYLNYDTDMSCEITGPIQLLPGTQWKIFQRLCAGLSSVAEQCGELIGDQIRQTQTMILEHKVEKASEQLGTSSTTSSSHVQEVETKKESPGKALLVREAARVLRKCSLEAISQIVKSLAISAAVSTGKEFTTVLLSWSPPDEPIAYETSLSSSAAGSSERDEGETANSKVGESAQGGDGVLRYWSDMIATDQQQRLAVAVPIAEELFETAFEIAQSKTLKKAVEYLIACNTITPAPMDIANFLRIHKERFDPIDLGLYLSEGGTGGAETEYWNSIRHTFIRAISFVGMNVEEG